MAKFTKHELQYRYRKCITQLVAKISFIGYTKLFNEYMKFPYPKHSIHSKNLLYLVHTTPDFY